MAEPKYNEDSIKSLDWKEHIRLRPGMYIGKLGDGSSQDDGIYILIKETIDNCIDEHVMGYGKNIDITIRDKSVTVRDYGRGIPLGKVIDCVSKINTGAKYDSEAFKKSVGLNGVGTKAVNALASHFTIQSIREGKTKVAEFERGVITKDAKLKECDLQSGTIVTFTPDEKLFGKYHFIHEYIERMCWNYAYLNTGLKLNYNGQEFVSQNGLKDLLERNLTGPILYPIIHLKGDDIEIAMTHAEAQYGEEYYSFVNGQHTTQGGTHQAAFREAVVKTIREFYKKEFEFVDIRTSIVAAISVKVQEPVFESQTKTKLGSQEIAPGGKSMKTFIGDFVKEALDNYLHKNPATAEELLKKIQQSEKERKELSGIQKLARERAKKASLHNRKLRDCRSHYNTNDDRRLETTLFICEGDSASGSITKVRDVNTQAVFSLKGKPLNAFGLTKKVVYENEEFNLLQAALNIEDNLDELRYNQVVVATDADVDGMHIRLLLLTFFLQFFPDLVKNGHVYILQTPLFRVRNKKETIYCYSEEARREAMIKLGGKPEITRFKGLGEISPDEFKNFIGKDMRIEPVIIGGGKSITDILSYYMGKNTQERQDFIINNLKIEKDLVEGEEVSKAE
ncbi:MAG: type IIA DNA topoisomerase subunit B [Bacteroidetes bacterium]|nr:type IIA DNA topoisomerase subunit B [Bacteroidota bacterium]